DVFADVCFWRSGLADRWSARLRSLELRRGSLRLFSCVAAPREAQRAFWRSGLADRWSARLRSRATPGTLRLFSCVAAPREAQRAKRGGARRDRTDDLMLAKHAL